MSMSMSMLIGNSSTSWSTVLIDVNVVVYCKRLVLLSLPIFTILKMSNCKKLIDPLCVHRSYHQNVKESLRLIYIHFVHKVPAPCKTYKQSQL